MPVIEISDPHVAPFPGFDSLLVDFDQLEAFVHDDCYAQWRTALCSVQRIDLIADRAERNLGRWWSTYARTGHGSNVALRSLEGADSAHRRYFQFSLPQDSHPNTSTARIDAAEKHYKSALLTRQHCLTRNGLVGDSR
ncbi:MAG: GIY-YIG nuclease family protein, partial [Nocardioides sp.]|nr:GIY-YIG nuclease family protein [Nocardioides sp.]